MGQIITFIFFCIWEMPILSHKNDTFKLLLAMLVNCHIFLHMCFEKDEEGCAHNFRDTIKKVNLIANKTEFRNKEI